MAAEAKDRGGKRAPKKVAKGGGKQFPRKGKLTRTQKASGSAPYVPPPPVDEG
jgi:hypothetical protein